MSETQQRMTAGLPERANQGAKVALRYVGPKGKKSDHLFGTRVTWNGPGDVQEVPAEFVPRFLRFSQVWRRPEEPWEPPHRPVAASALVDLVRSGDWAAIKALAPGIYAQAAAHFGAMQAPEGAEPVKVSPWRKRDDETDEEWAARMLDGTSKTLDARLDNADADLRARPELYEVLGQVEVASKNRRSILDLIEMAEAKTLSGQTALLDTDDTQTRGPDQ